MSTFTERDGPYAGYLFAHFVGGDHADAEQVYFALSEGPDPLRWRPLNAGRPALRATVGTGGARDPFLVRGPDGRVWCLATDLSIHHGRDWTHAMRHGSRSILVWSTDDLVTWSPPQLLEIAPPHAGDAWAPKAYFDPARGDFRILFSSVSYPDGDRTVPSYHRILQVRSRDFQTASAPEVYLERAGTDTIDLALLTAPDAVHRFFPDDGFVVHERGTDMDGVFTTVSTGIGRGTLERGEGPAVFTGLAGRTWYLFIDEFGGRGYIPFTTDDLRSGWTAAKDHLLPPNARHGSVLALTATEYARLARLE
ncbi:glycoside hydrolase family 43 protein [Nonomuraea sp. NPDC026600]|uniref:glycoside hydrolase family 43 protein n=1 Tax=Nonomuraea sp. NPDC026600 TaxID=3155363 RepID=UPI0033FA0631